MKPEVRPVIIAAGGTGGHVYPGLAVARELLARGVPVIWMGTRKGLEARVVPEAGIPMRWLSVSGLRGKGLWTWILAPLRLAQALTQAGLILVRERPRAVLGMGGFVAGPGGLMAAVLRYPLIVHEQNAAAGLTNRILARLSRRVLEGFAGTFEPARRARATGNPVRLEIAALEPPATRFAGREGRLRLLVIGGSQGALALNRLVPEALAGLETAIRPEVRHQVGPRHLDVARRAYAESGVEADLRAFIEDMAEAYAWADFVVCRAGALTIAELTAAGIGALLVPYPYAVDDHQSANARFMVEAGAGLMIQQAELDAPRLSRELDALCRDRSRVHAMAEAARGLARADAAARVADVCLEAALGGKGRLETGEKQL